MITKANVQKGDKRGYLVCVAFALLVYIYKKKDERYQKLKKDYDELSTAFIDMFQQYNEFEICNQDTIIWLCDELDKGDDRDISGENIQKIRDVSHKAMLESYKALRKTVM